MIMKRIIVVLVLFFCATSAMGDIWRTLYSNKLQEAINGNGEAQYDVGAMHQNGRGVKADRDEAIKWYKKAAAQGVAKAQSRLNLMESNAARFNKTILKAAEGDRDSLYDMGNMYMKGVGTHIDYAKAVSAFKQSADLGHIKSAYKLGLIYLEGTGVKTSGKEAFKWFKLAAENGNPAAQYYLGKLYADGTGTRRNRTEALIWLGKSVDGGFDQARGEMINISESMKMVEAGVVTVAKAAPVASNEEVAAIKAAEKKSAAAKQAAAKKAAAKQAARKKAAAKKAAAKQAAAKQAAVKYYSFEDLMRATWTRNGKPVSYLPSAINNCRPEGNKVICFSDDQTRNSGANVIKFKTKAFISNFSSKGEFDVTYRNLVVNARQIEDIDSVDTLDEPGSLDDGTQQAYQVKTGWSNPHDLKCRMQNRDSISCVKNSTHAFLLKSSTTLAAGK
jgi:hypothetical protein